MNERIKEIAEQAGITTNLDTDYFEKDANKWVDYFSEKFAELLIQECIGVASAQRNPQNLNYKPSERFVADLKQHFGIKD